MSNIQTNSFKAGGFVRYEGIVFEIVAVLKTDHLLLASIGAPVPMSECFHIPLKKLQYASEGSIVKSINQPLINKFKWNK